MSDYLIGRQQIFDRNLHVFAYELLFRGDSSLNLADETEAYQATNEIVVDTLLEHGLRQVVGPHLAFINFTSINLIDKTALLLPKDRVVIEVVENIRIDQEIIAAVDELSKAGYIIALDDFIFPDERLPLLKLASIIKIDIRDKKPGEIAKLVEQLKPYPVKLVAEKVETYAEYDLLRALGCHYFQGFFFSKPNLVPGKRVDILQNSAVRLLALIHKADIESEELTEVISRDVGLSYKLLQYINSAYFGLQRTIESIQQAILYLGIKQIKLWATILMLSSFSNKPSELLNVSLTRAKICETLATLAGKKNTEHFFLVGLMSTLDSLLDRPMYEILETLPLSKEVRNAILLKTGIAGEALQCVVNYEQWETARIVFQNLPPGKIRKAFLDSLEWANDLTQQINRLQ